MVVECALSCFESPHADLVIACRTRCGEQTALRCCFQVGVIFRTSGELVRGQNQTGTMPKKLMWRLQGIPAGTSKDDVLQFFEPEEQGGLHVKTLCPDVDDPARSLTATFEYNPRPDNADAPPALRDNLSHCPSLERDFMGFTPLYHPPSSTCVAE